MSWLSTMVPGVGPHGKPIVSVIAKRTYEISPGKMSLADEQLPITTSELPTDPTNPYYSEIHSESDLVAFKPFTDIVVLGKAYTPKGKRAYNLECGIQAGPARKSILVYGQRMLEYKMMRGYHYSDPIPFESMDIGYANAFGGRAQSKDGTHYPYPPNPLGKGFNLKGGFEEYSDITVPCVEDPESPIEPDCLICDKYEDWKDLPKPASFGWTRQSFFPRYTYAGIIPELPGAYAAGVEINPNLPKMDFRFFQGASNGLCNHVLNGDEHVKLSHLDREYPSFEYALPGERPEIIIKSSAGSFSTDSVLQTVLINMEEKLVCLVWRGSIEQEKAGEIGKELIEFTV